jgi:hypothetical protein
MHYYYSIYRKDYLYKGLVLYESMKEHDVDFKFFLVCMDEESVQLLKKMNYIDLKAISIKEIEKFDTRIPELKSQRGEKTYIWTAKASAALYIFDKYEEVDHVIWVDGDTAFLSDPKPIYEEWKDYSVLLTPERFTGEYEYLGHLVGFYNTGFMGFKRDEVGMKCLEYFRERLQEWKNSEEEQGNWNDQIYVDDWLERFHNIGVNEHDGINLTPFIASRINTESNGFVNIKNGIPHIKDTPIVLYHYMAMKYYDGNEFDLCYYWMKFDSQTIQKIYLPYFKKCNEAYARIREVDPDFYPHLTIKDKYIGNYFNLEANNSGSVYHLCTVTQENQLAQTLSLYDSIKKYNLSFMLWICCADEYSYQTLKMLALPYIHLFEPSNLIENYDQLIQTGYRAGVEILKPRLINLLLLNNYSLQSMLYVDCDCLFHQSPKFYFDLLKKNAILLCGNSTAVENEANISNAIIGFNRDDVSLNCQFYWIEKTKEWIKNGVSIQDEINYISKWKKMYDKVIILENPAYLLDDEKLRRVKVKKINDVIYVNNKALILYKYHLSHLNDANIERFAKEILRLAPINKKHIYLPYLKGLRLSLDILNRSGHK